MQCPDSLTEHPEDGAAVVRLLPGVALRDAPVETAPSAVVGDCRCHRGRGRRRRGRRVVDGRLQKGKERSLYCD